MIAVELVGGLSKRKQDPDSVLGWNLLEAAKGKVLERHKDYFIAELEKGEKRYCLDAFPRLTFGEAYFLHDALVRLQSSSRQLAQEGTAQFLKNYCIGTLTQLDRKQTNYMPLLLQKLVFGFGALDFLLADDEIEEIAVIGTGKEKPVHVFHTRFGWLKTNLYFTDGKTVRDAVNRMAACIGRHLTLNSPVLNATLPDGSRLNAAINPVSFTGPSVTIRKFKKNPFTPLQLIENRTFSAELMAFLWVALQCDCSLLIAGNTGSGKTSSLNALFGFVPATERIVVVEETPEIRLPHQHMVKLNVVKEQGIAMQQLIVDTLRMRPDRIVVGEVRSSEETKAFIDTLLAGQGKGSYATFHSQSSREALNRMKALGASEADLAALDLILVQRRWNIVGRETGMAREVRRVVEATELIEQGGRVLFNCLFRHDFQHDRLLQVGESRRVMQKAMNCFSLNRKQLLAETRRRVALLEKRKGRKIGMQDFFHWANFDAGKKRRRNSRKAE